MMNSKELEGNCVQFQGMYNPKFVGRDIGTNQGTSITTVANSNEI